MLGPSGSVPARARSGRLQYARAWLLGKSPRTSTRAGASQLGCVPECGAGKPQSAAHPYRRSTARSATPSQPPLHASERRGPLNPSGGVGISKYGPSAQPEHGPSNFSKIWLGRVVEFAEADLLDRSIPRSNPGFHVSYEFPLILVVTGPVQHLWVCCTSSRGSIPWRSDPRRNKQVLNDLLLSYTEAEPIILQPDLATTWWAHVPHSARMLTCLQLSLRSPSPFSTLFLVPRSLR